MTRKRKETDETTVQGNKSKTLPVSRNRKAEMENVEENNHNIIGNTSDQVVNQEINDQENNYHQEMTIQKVNNRESRYQDIFTRPINFDEILKAYDFIGKLISQTEENNNCIELKFRTFYQAKFMENYYISLDKVKINKAITFTIRNHTLPDFIPLIELKLRYLDKDLNKFVDTVDDFLQAYVIKREEVKRLQAQSFINLKADTSYSLIEIYVSLEESTVEIKLKYRDLRSPFPTDASLYQICPNPKNSEPHRQRLKKREKEFKDKVEEDLKK
ncbi:15347_t:CDS:2 [Entrophospora sp. SA101]|nr:379_t:CDS:2 [Entrophospora sp. SA101]CAJ0632231.1 15347_t:CDS:2 [Entrophospora sp. SA101]CAJ0829292.1 848_t:CDS:2 [Entrophospora sp. SA101]CAJ0906318.1 7834_t:CDS:2 [Entrophospora sp. SA101]